MRKVKYIKTKEKQIIVFSELITHSEFRSFDPISAGFINWGRDTNNNLTAECYGESVSLNLESNPEDSELATKQILKYY